MAFIKAYSLVIAPDGAGEAPDVISGGSGAVTPNGGGLDVSALRMSFYVKKDITKPTPNHADIRVYNLSSKSQRFLENSKVLSVRLEAGYKDEGTSQIYLGEIRHADTTTHGPDSVTKMTTDDKGRKMQKTRINIPLGAGVPLSTVMGFLVDVLGVGRGNMDKTLASLADGGGASLHPRGGVLSGYAAQELTDLCNSAGLFWSIEDGVLYLSKTDLSVQATAIQLSSSTGLMKSPTIDNEGIMTAETIMIPGMRPGVIVDFDAKNLKGGYLVTKCEYHGDTHGRQWHIRIHGKKH